VVVELAFGDAPFELRPEDGDRVIQLRASAVLWQKERLLSIAREHLPPECDKVVWLDADVLFENDGWVARTSELLEFIRGRPALRHRLPIAQGRGRRTTGRLAVWRL
jgi:hypothetical protein